MNSHIKGTMGCSSNQNTINSLLKMARGSDQRISMFENNSHRELQFTSLSSKLKITDALICECLQMCNQNFDKHKYYHCVRISKDNWMVWNFTSMNLKLMTELRRWSQSFSMCITFVWKDFSRFRSWDVNVCFMTGESGYWLIWIHMFEIKYEFIHDWRMNSNMIIRC